MEYNPPNWSPKRPLTARTLNDISDAIRWHHARFPYVGDIGTGSVISGTYGLGMCLGYIYIDPASYPGYDGHPSYWGLYRISLPSGLFVPYGPRGIITVQIQAASGGNGGLQASISNEGITGINVFAFDSGMTTISGHAIWLMAIGALAQGKIPAPQPGNYGPPTWTNTSELTSARLGQITNSINWQHARIPYAFDLQGNLIESTAGLGMLTGYFWVDPHTYPDYEGAGSFWGRFYLPFPTIFSQLLFVRVQPAADADAPHRRLVATVSGESPAGVTVFVYETGRARIGLYAVWVTAVGRLHGGILP